MGDDKPQFVRSGGKLSECHHDSRASEPRACSQVEDNWQAIHRRPSSRGHSASAMHPDWGAFDPRAFSRVRLGAGHWQYEDARQVLDDTRQNNAFEPPLDTVDEGVRDLNFDQSPVHYNEPGRQRTPTVAAKDSTVPVAEGSSDARSRWTANLPTTTLTTTMTRKFPTTIPKRLSSTHLDRQPQHRRII